MFLKYIRDFGLKKIINKSLSNYKPVSSPDVVSTVGILIDESYFADREMLIDALAAQGILWDDITTLSFKEKSRAKEAADYDYFTRKDISSAGEFTKQAAADFLNTPFDMLISYYDIQKPPLVLATIKSKAQFKVGFSTIDKRLNTFMIGTVAERYDEFTAELFKYLKILNKL